MGDWRRSAREGLRLSRKVGVLARNETYRRGLRRGVAAAIEHREAFFEHDFRTVVDAGAGRGQFALFALRQFPRAHVFCFEPLPESHARLARVTGDSERVTVFDLALGAAPGEGELNVSAAHDSSSLLAITEAQTSAYPGTASVGKVSVVAATLDCTLPSELLVRPSLLKIDVQGFELEVLRGAERSLRSIDQIIVECSFVELYAGQPLADAVVCHLRALGFGLSGVHSVARSPEGRPLQADLVFSRRSAEPR